jgi:hypothetical protein
VTTRVARSAWNDLSLRAGIVAAFFLAFAIANDLKLYAAAILGLVAVTPLALFFSSATLLIWVATGPTLGGWLAFVPGHGLPAVSPDRVILVFLTAVCLIRWLRHSATMIRPGRIEMMMAFFLALAAVSAFITGPTHLYLEGGGRRQDLVFLLQSYAGPYLGFFLAKNLLAGDRIRRSILWVYVVIGVAIAGVAILNYFTGLALFRPDRYEVIHAGRATGTLSSAVHLGLILDMGLFPAIILLLGPRTLGRKLFLGSAVLMMLVAMYLSKTRAAYVGFALGVVVAAVYDRRLRRPLLATAFVAVLALMAAWPFVVNSGFVQKRLLEATPVYNRIALAATSVNMISQKPILGFGFGRYTFRVNRAGYLKGAAGVSREYATNLDDPHDDYLGVLVLLGIVGFLPYAGILFLTLRRCVQVLRLPRPASPAERDLAVVALASLACYLEHGVFDGLMFCWYASNMVFVLLGAVERTACDRRAQIVHD